MSLLEKTKLDRVVLTLLIIFDLTGFDLVLVGHLFVDDLGGHIGDDLVGCNLVEVGTRDLEGWRNVVDVPLGGVLVALNSCGESLRELKLHRVRSVHRVGSKFSSSLCQTIRPSRTVLL